MINELRDAVGVILRVRFSGSLPWNQNTGTAFAVELTGKLAPPATNPVFYGRPRPGSRQLIEA
jgi:hypothetical protein